MFLPRSNAKITGVTIRMWTRLLNIPPMTGMASGFITSEPVQQRDNDEQRGGHDELQLVRGCGPRTPS